MVLLAAHVEGAPVDLDGAHVEGHGGGLPAAAATLVGRVVVLAKAAAAAAALPPGARREAVGGQELLAELLAAEHVHEEVGGRVKAGKEVGNTGRIKFSLVRLLYQILWKIVQISVLKKSNYCLYVPLEHAIALSPYKIGKKQANFQLFFGGITGITLLYPSSSFCNAGERLQTCQRKN